MTRLIPRAACALLYATASLAPCAGAQVGDLAVQLEKLTGQAP